MQPSAARTASAAVPRQRRNRPYAFKLVWPEICRRLEARPNLNACELFDQLRLEYPGRYLPGQLKALQARIEVWRVGAVARDVVIGHLRYRRSGRPRTWRTRIDPLESVWPELCLHLDSDPDQTGRELLNELQSRFPDRYRPGLLRTLQRRLQGWRAQAARRLVFGVSEPTILLRDCSLPGQGGEASPP